MNKLQVSKISGKFYSQDIPCKTVEQKVGTWIDGKPIYRMVITGTKVSGSDLLISNIQTNVKQILFYYGVLTATSSSGNKLNYPLSYYEGSSNNHHSSFNIYPLSNNKLEFRLSGTTSIYNNGDVTAIVFYTKTTD